MKSKRQKCGDVERLVLLVCWVRCLQILEVWRYVST